MSLDEELRTALRREDPPPGFAQRVVARAQSAPARKPLDFWARFWPGSRMAWAAAIAALLLIASAATIEYRQMKAERATREAVLALRIASEKLNLARDRVLKRTEN